jgi:anaphase-promoting complex subunit 1
MSHRPMAIHDFILNVSTLNIFTDACFSARRLDKITVQLFDSRADHKLERSFLAIHFASVKKLSIFMLARIPAEDTLRVYPATTVPALSIVATVAFRAPLLDLLVVKPDNTLAMLTHGLRIVDIQLGPRQIPLPRFGTRTFGSDLGSGNAMSVDEPSSTSRDGDDRSDASMHSIIDKKKIVAVSEPLHNAVTIHFEDGSTTRTKFVASARDQLTVQCLYALSYALTGSRAFMLQSLWIAKWQARGASDADDDEWKCFVDALCGMVGVQSPYHIEDATRVAPDSWEALAYSASHERLEHDVVFRSLDAPFRSQPINVKPPMKKPHEDIVPCLLALHTLGESYKLNNDAIRAYLPRLAKLIIALGQAARPEWADHWVRLFPDILEGWADPRRQGMFFRNTYSCLYLVLSENFADPRLRPQTPDVYGYLFTRLVENNAKPNWTHLPHISHLYHFEPAMQYGRVDPMQDLYRLFSVWECFADSTVPTARKRAENALQALVRLGYTNDEIDRLPYGIAQPIREALRTCQSLPGVDWPAQAYELALRPDLAQMVSGDANHAPSRDNFRQVDKHLVSIFTH